MGTNELVALADRFAGLPVPIDSAPDHVQETGIERNIQTMAVWMGHWVLNSVRNVELLQVPEAHSLTELRGIGRGKPCVIIGAGPSLDDDLDAGAAEVLREYSKRGAMILCPNSCARPLLARGIAPWAYVAMHPTQDIAESFHLRPGVPMNPSGAKLITATAIHPDVLKLWLNSSAPGDVYLTLQHHIEHYKLVSKLDDARKEAQVVNVDSSSLPSDWYGVCQHSIWHHKQHDMRKFPWQARRVPLPSIPNAGCVANYAVLCASVLECSPVVLLGVDYALTPDKAGHLRYKCDDWTYDANGKWQRDHRMERDQLTIFSQQLHEVDGVTGSKRYTHAYMLGYANSMRVLRNQATMMDGSTMLDIVNAGSDGILTGIPRVDLRDTLDKAVRGCWPKREVAA